VSSPPAPKPVADRWSAGLLGGLFVAATVILDLLFYDIFTADQHFFALLWIGVFALFFSLGCYLAESFSRRPVVQRALAWGYFGMGFAVLFLAVALAPSYAAVTQVLQLFGLLLLVIALIVAVALIAWRGRALRATANREVPKAAWRVEPATSAFSYSTANAPSVPEASPPTPPPPRSP